MKKQKTDSKKVYDLIIIGAGPAGLTAAVYAARYKLDSLIIAKATGGLAATAHKVCNFPSYSEVKGYELMQKMDKQVKELNVPSEYGEAVKLEKDGSQYLVKTENQEFYARKILIASGSKYKKLNVPGEGKFQGRGVSYCATCDGAFFGDQIVCVVGGSDAAVTAALLLSEFAKKVYIIYRKEELRAEPVWVDLLKKDKKIESLLNEDVIEILGETQVTDVKLKSGKSLKVDGCFIEIGSIPNSDFAKEAGVKLDDSSHIIVDSNQRTNLPGVFAAGDITHTSLRQIVTACADGAKAAYAAYTEIKQQKR